MPQVRLLLVVSPCHLVKPTAHLASLWGSPLAAPHAAASPAHASHSTPKPSSSFFAGVFAALAVGRADPLPLSVHQSIPHQSDQTTPPSSPLLSQEFPLRWLWDSPCHNSHPAHNSLSVTHHPNTPMSAGVFAALAVGLAAALPVLRLWRVLPGRGAGHRHLPAPQADARRHVPGVWVVCSTLGGGVTSTCLLFVAPAALPLLVCASL